MSENVTADQAEKVLRSSEHATREIQDLSLTITDITTAAEIFVRITGSLSGTVVHSDWLLPNLAVRLTVPALDGGVASRIYTVRSFDPTSETIELDILLHEHESPMMRWVRAARVGDVVPLVGPRPHFVPDYDAGRPTLLLADDSAVAALYALFRQWPEGAEGIAYVRTDHDEVVDELEAPGSVTVHRTDGTLLEAAKNAPADVTLWAAGERTEMRAIRDYFRKDVGFPRDEVRPFGYWQSSADSTLLDNRRLVHFNALIERGESTAEVDDLDI